MLGTVDGISRTGDEYLLTGKDGDVVTLPLSNLMDGFIDLLDNWVERGVAPPPTMSSWRELGDADKDDVMFIISFPGARGSTDPKTRASRRSVAKGWSQGTGAPLFSAKEARVGFSTQTERP